eukprot:1382973-Pleurochrysis_carterae.AAC.1
MVLGDVARTTFPPPLDRREFRLSAQRSRNFESRPPNQVSLQPCPKLCIFCPPPSRPPPLSAYPYPPCAPKLPSFALPLSPNPPPLFNLSPISPLALTLPSRGKARQRSRKVSMRLPKTLGQEREKLPQKLGASSVRRAGKAPSKGGKRLGKKVANASSKGRKTSCQKGGK